MKLNEFPKNFHFFPTAAVKRVNTESAEQTKDKEKPSKSSSKSHYLNYI